MSICEDKYGQIWIGTFRGLNKNDGNQYHQYYCVDDSLGLPDNHITHIYREEEDSSLLVFKDFFDVLVSTIDTYSVEIAIGLV